MLFEKIFTKNELKKIKTKSPQHIAGIFSAKEAIIKAYNPLKKLHFKDIEIFNNKDGSPYSIIKSRIVKDLKISISHTKNHAIAAAILLRP